MTRGIRSITCCLVWIVLGLGAHSAHAGLTLYASDGAGQIVGLGPDGTLVSVFATRDAPQGLAVDASGNLYAALAISGTVNHFAPDGTPLGIFASGLAGPQGIVFDRSGNLYVADVGTIQEFAADGTALGAFASGLGTPVGLAFDAAGNLYVSDANDNTVKRFAADGTDLGVFVISGLDLPQSLAFDALGNLYVANFGDDSVRRFAPDGTDLGVFASAGLSGPVGLAFDPVGNLLVSSIFSGAILRCGPDGSDGGEFASGVAAPTFLAFAERSPTAVPEPSSVLLLAAGIGTLLLASERRRAARDLPPGSEP